MKSFKALFNRKYGELKIEAGQISFINAEENIEIKIPFHDLETEVISENNDQILLSSRSQGITISTYDLEVSNALVKQGYGGVGSLRSKLYKTQKLKFVTIFFIVFTPLFFLLILPLSIKFIPVKYYEDYVSISSLKVLGEPALASFNAKSTAVSFKIQDLAQKIIDHNPELQNIPFEYYFSSSKEVNAFALPGGIIVFNRGFLEQLDSISELYGVLAHEMAHVQQRHILQSLVSKTAPFIGIIALELMLSGSSNVVFALTSFIDLAYSRDTEKKADYFAMKYLAAAQMNSDGLERFFTKISNESFMFEDIISTHPSGKKRLELMRSNKLKFNSNNYSWDESELEEIKLLLK